MITVATKSIDTRPYFPMKCFFLSDSILPFHSIKCFLSYEALANCIKYLDLINYYAHPIINVMAHQYFLLLSCICIFLKFLFLNDCENVYKNYKIFSTSIYFAEIAKVFKKAIIPNINKSHHSVLLFSILIICLKWLFMLYTNFLLNISSQYIYIYLATSLFSGWFQISPIWSSISRASL